MNLSRRGFLAGLVAAGSVVAIDPASALAFDAPTLYGDGFHDDTVALQAFFDGKPIRHAGAVYARKEGERLTLCGGRFCISDTIQISHQRPAFLRDCHFFWWGSSGPALSVVA